jgi:hypothetical protein
MGRLNRLDNILGGVQKCAPLSESSNSKGVDGMADSSELDLRPFVVVDIKRQEIRYELDP